jgi:hypothetical protein
MALFGSFRDIGTFKVFTKELIEDIISQEVGYYKIMLSDTPVNVYGEGKNKYFIGPILIPCLIERGEFQKETTDFGLDTRRDVQFRFFRDHLVEANVVPEVGDYVMYNEAYYEIDNVNENQYILGKDPNYIYSSALNGFGETYSIILTGHYASPDKLGITQERL